MNYKLLVCDIDGTLIPYSRDHISKKLKDGLNQAKENGLQVLIATGRHFAFIHKSIFEDINPDYLVTINGACLVDKHGVILESHPISELDFFKIIDLCKTHDIGLGFKFKEGVVGYHNYAKFYQGYVGNNDYGDAVFENPVEEDFHIKHGMPLGIFLIGEEAVIETFKTQIPDLLFAWSYKDGYDVYPLGFSKAMTIETVLKMNSFTWDNVMSFGDAENDIEMLRRAHTGVAMGNAKDIVKKEADFVTTSVDDDGIVHALKHFNLI